MFTFLCLLSNTNETLPTWINFFTEHFCSLTPKCCLIQLRWVAGVKSFREQQMSLRHQSCHYPLSPKKCLILATSAKVPSVTISGFIHSCVTNSERCFWVFYPRRRCAKKCTLRQPKSNCPLGKQFRLAKTSVNPVSKRPQVLATCCIFYQIKTRACTKEFKGIWNDTFVLYLSPSEYHVWEFFSSTHPWDFKWEI